MEKYIEVVIGIAKCPNTRNLYGVRVELNKNARTVTATWAFPIEPEVAKRETPCSIPISPYWSVS